MVLIETKQVFSVVKSARCQQKVEELYQYHNFICQSKKLHYYQFHAEQLSSVNFL